MGIWGAICSGARKVVDAGKKVVDAGKRVVEGVVEFGKEVIGNVKEDVTNVWNKYSGKDKFEEAERLYEKITERYNARRKKFETDLESYTTKIEKHIEVINKSKERIKRELFPSMAKKMEKIKDIAVSSDFSVEEYIAASLSFDSVRSKSDLYKIDFNKHKFKTTFQAVITLGFYTRKKAKETFYAVQEEEKKIEKEIKEMESTLIQLKEIEQSLDNVEHYFTSLILQYENLLNRLDNAVNFLYVRCMVFAHKIIAEEMSIRRLPIMQRKEVEAVITSSKILKVMTETQIVSIEDGEDINNYSKNMKKQYEEMMNVYAAA